MNGGASEQARFLALDRDPERFSRIGYTSPFASGRGVQRYRRYRCDASSSSLLQDSRTRRRPSSRVMEEPEGGKASRISASVVL
jgi:hypothetical protein